MKASEIMIDIISKEYYEANKAWTCDTCKAGDPEREISKIGTCLTATPDVIRAAAEWGADLLITHEPTYYIYEDKPDDSVLSKLKHKLIKESNLTIWRYHDSMHLRDVDEISKAFIEKLGLRGEFDGQVNFTLDEPAEASELVQRAGKLLDLCHPRIIGSRTGAVTKLGIYLGQRGEKCYEEFMTSDRELCFSGEICEWKDGEPARDAAQFGLQKTIVVLGHAGSERLGMEILARDINGKYDGAEAKYFECGELYSY